MITGVLRDITFSQAIHIDETRKILEPYIGKVIDLHLMEDCNKKERYSGFILEKEKNGTYSLVKYKPLKMMHEPEVNLKLRNYDLLITNLRASKIGWKTRDLEDIDYLTVRLYLSEKEDSIEPDHLVRAN